MLWKETIGNLKNKIEYNIHKAVYDPDAEEYNKKKTDAQIDNFDISGAITIKQPTDIVNITNTDPNFSIGRLIGKIVGKTVTYITIAIIPFIILSIGMLVANDMIVYPAPLRIFGFLSTILNPIIASLALIYYSLRALYSTYMKYRNKTDEAHKYELPSIFAFLPITSYIASSSIGKFFMYPFNYPKTDEDASKLPILASEHVKNLEDSFSNFNSVKQNRLFSELLKSVKSELVH